MMAFDGILDVRYFWKFTGWQIIVTWELGTDNSKDYNAIFPSSKYSFGHQLTDSLFT